MEDREVGGSTSDQRDVGFGTASVGSGLEGFLGHDFSDKSRENPFSKLRQFDYCSWRRELL